MAHVGADGRCDGVVVGSGVNTRHGPHDPRRSHRRESVYVSRATAAEAIRKQVARDVATGAKTDTEIIGSIADSFNAQVLLVPRATGLDSLVWVLPIAVFVCAVVGLAIAFRRWRGQNVGDATDEDFALVNSLLGEDPKDDENV